MPPKIKAFTRKQIEKAKEIERYRQRNLLLQRLEKEKTLQGQLSNNQSEKQSIEDVNSSQISQEKSITNEILNHEIQNEKTAELRSRVENMLLQTSLRKLKVALQQIHEVLYIDNLNATPSCPSLHSVVQSNELPLKPLKAKLPWLTLQQQDLKYPLSLNEEIEAFLSFIKLDKYEEFCRDVLIADVEREITNKWPGVRLVYYGSHAMGLAIFCSDIDMSIDTFHENHHELIGHVANRNTENKVIFNSREKPFMIVEEENDDNSDIDDIDDRDSDTNKIINSSIHNKEYLTMTDNQIINNSIDDESNDDDDDSDDEDDNNNSDDNSHDDSNSNDDHHDSEENEEEDSSNDDLKQDIFNVSNKTSINNNHGPESPIASEASSMTSKISAPQNNDFSDNFDFNILEPISLTSLEKSNSFNINSFALPLSMSSLSSRKSEHQVLATVTKLIKVRVKLNIYLLYRWILKIVNSDDLGHSE